MKVIAILVQQVDVSNRGIMDDRDQLVASYQIEEFNDKYAFPINKST